MRTSVPHTVSFGCPPRSMSDQRNARTSPILSPVTSITTATSSRSRQRDRPAGSFSSACHSWMPRRSVRTSATDNARTGFFFGVESFGIPEDIGPASLKLWKACAEAFELEEHEQAVLEEACRIRDRISQIRRQVDADGVMLESSQGMRLHPGIAEGRQQKLALARLLVTLGLPGEEDLPKMLAPCGACTGEARCDGEASSSTAVNGVP